MHNKLIILIAVFFKLTTGFAQIEKLNIKKFGAIPNDKKNDDLAFTKAVEYINKKNGNVELFIPAGNYILGFTKKERQINRARLNGNLNFQYCNNVTIKGENGTYIKIKDNLEFGTFDDTSTALKKNKNFYNPTNPSLNKNKASTATEFADFLKKATAFGFCFSFKFCKNVKLQNFILDGNCNRLVLGGNWGIGPNPYELSFYGIFINNTKQVKIDNITVKNFACDNICISNHLYTEEEKKFTTQNIQIRNSDFLNAGRNNLTWIGGDSIFIKDCKFNNAGSGIIKTAPGAGIDIEPESYSDCTNGVFENCEVRNSIGLALSMGYPSTTKFMLFKNCKFECSNYMAVGLDVATTKFVDCEFKGIVLCQVKVENKKDQSEFVRCKFIEHPTVFSKTYLFCSIYNGVNIRDSEFQAYQSSLINMEVIPSNNIQPIVENCRFISTSTKTYMGNIAFLFRQTFIKDCSFEYKKGMVSVIGQDEGNATLNCKFKAN
jgi:hypothetical protein